MAPTNVTTNSPQQPNAMGGAATTTQNVTGTIAPTPAPITTPSAQPAAPQPAAPSAQPNQPAQPNRPVQPPLHTRIFDSVLRTLGGGPVYVNRTDPTTGETTRVAVANQTRGQLGRSILAGAITGMMSGMAERDQFGRRDPTKAAVAGFAAGNQLREQRQATLQGNADTALSRKQAVMKANLDQAHLMLALNQGKQNMFENASKINQAGILEDARNYDKSLTDPNQPRAILKTNLTHDQALQELHGKWSDQLAQIDGYTIGPNGDITPTFTVLNPNAQVKMNEQAAQEFARFNPSFTNAWQSTGGNIPMALRNYAMLSNTLQSLEHMDALFSQEADTFGFKNTDFANAVKGIPGGINAVIQAENAIGAAGTPIDAMQRLSTAPGGTQILAKMGVDPKKVNDLFLEEQRQYATAKEGGMGPKSPAPDDMVDNLLTSLDQSQIPDEMKRSIRAGTKKDADGRYNLNMQQAEDLRNRILSAQNETQQINERNLLANGDPAQMTKTAQNTIEGDVNDVTKIASMRGNARNNAVNAMHDQAAALGLDTTNYSEAALDSQANMWKDYSGGQRTPTGKQLASFDAFLGHTGEALAAENRLANKYLGLYHQPLVNKTMKELGAQLTDDADWAAYSASMEPVKHEIENFLAAGFATKAEDAEAMRSILNDTLPINRVNAVLKQLGDTADVRLAALGKAYTNNMGRNFPTLLSPEAKQTLDKLGIQSKAAPYSVPLPKGWNNHQLTPLTPGTPNGKQIAGQFLRASGGDKTAAMELAKRNGWNLVIN